MALLIDNDVTERVLDTADAVDVLTDAFEQLARGDAVFQPRTDVVSPDTVGGEGYDWDGDPECYAWGSLLGAIREPPRLALRFKSDVLSWEDTGEVTTESKFNVEPGTYMGFVLLVDTSTGELIGLLNDGALQHVRVGATAGVACDRLARADAATVGMLGSGGMARTYLEAFDAVRDLERVRVYSPTPEHREAYAEEMAGQLDLAVEAVGDPETAVRGVDIVATCTDAREPVYRSEWLSPGTFLVNSVPTEMDAATHEAVDRVVTTDPRAFESHVIGDRGDRETYERRRGAEWFRPREHPSLADLLGDAEPARRDLEETVLHDNISAGIQFAAVGDLVHRRAAERGLGVEVPLSWFQQDVRN